MHARQNHTILSDMWLASGLVSPRKKIGDCRSSYEWNAFIKPSSSYSLNLILFSPFYPLR